MRKRGRFGSLLGAAIAVVMVGLIGAADSLAQAAAASRMSRKEAIRALTRIMLGALKV